MLGLASGEQHTSLKPEFSGNIFKPQWWLSLQIFFWGCFVLFNHKGASLFRRTLRILLGKRITQSRTFLNFSDHHPPFSIWAGSVSCAAKCSVKREGSLQLGFLWECEDKAWVLLIAGPLIIHLVGDQLLNKTWERKDFLDPFPNYSHCVETIGIL